MEGLNKHDISILIPDGEEIVLIKVLQCISEIKGLRTYVLSSKKNTPMRFSRYVSTYLHFPYQEQPEKWISKINQVILDHQIDVLLPVSEKAIRNLILNRELLKCQEKVLLPESLEKFDIAMNKWRLIEHLRAHGLPCPKSQKLTQNVYLQKDIIKLKFPILLKPTLAGESGKGIKKFNSMEDFYRHLPHLDTSMDFKLQEFVQGVDMGVNVLCKEGKILAHTIQLGTLFRKESFRPQIGLRMVVEDNVLAIIKKLMASLNWNGVAHIDLLYNVEARNFSILEINPRYWLTLPASCLAGVNFPWLYCLTVLKVDYKTPEYIQINYMEPRGLIMTIRKNPTSILKLGAIWKETPVKFLLKDPFMIAYHIISIMHRKLKQVF